MSQLQKTLNLENDKLQQVIKKEIELRFSSDLELKKIINQIFNESND